MQHALEHAIDKEAVAVFLELARGGINNKSLPEVGAHRGLAPECDYEGPWKICSLTPPRKTCVILLLVKTLDQWCL